MPQQLETLQSTQPFLRWPGGKRWLLPHLRAHLPEIRTNTYWEPFVGSGSLFFANIITADRKVIADLLPPLVDTYIAVRDNVSQVIKYLEQHSNTSRHYYRVRNQNYRSRYARAALFIYLNRAAFNGIYRVNQSGDFNVPFGNKFTPDIVRAETLNCAAAMLQNADIRCADFAKVLSEPTKGDLVYLDPPYTVMHNHNGFLRYNAHIFSWKDQVRLAQCMQTLSDKGVKVIMSNAAHSSIIELYKKFNIQEVQRNSLIAASTAHRASISELLIKNF